MKIKKELWPAIILLAIFLAVFVTRALTFTLDEESYFSLRYIQHVRENKLPLFYDSFSYGGRELEEPFLSYYLLAIGSEKYISISILSLIVVLVYLTAFRISRDKGTALIASLFSGFVPISFSYNILSPHTLAFFLVIVVVYSFLHINENNKGGKVFLYIFLLASFLLPFTSTLSLFFAASLLVYVLVSALEKKLSRLELEAIVFAIFINLLVYLVMFRKALLEYGFSIVWQNTPTSVLASYFQHFELVNSVYSVGTLLLLFGIIGMLISFKTEARLLGAFIIASLLFLWLKLVPFKTGLILFSLLLAPLAALGLNGMLKFLKDTRFTRFKHFAEIVVIVLVILSSVVPSIIAAREFREQVITKPAVLKAFSSIQDKASVVAAPYEYGNVIAFYGNKNIVDSGFLLAPTPEQRLQDIQGLYLANNDAIALQILRRYNASFLFVNEDVKQKYQVKELAFLSRQCFRKFYDDENETKVYGIFC